MILFNREKRIWNEEMRKLRAERPDCVSPELRKEYFDLWKASLQKGRNPMVDQQPWLTFAAIDLLNRFLKSEMRVFEFGGGGSTLFFTKRCAEVVTVEHDEKWFPAIEKAVKAQNRTNWRGMLRTPASGIIPGATIADPGSYISEDSNYEGLNFRAYASAIDEYADRYFDVVIVDGRARPSCLKHGIPKLKTGGLLVLDNSDRKYYLQETQSLISTTFEILLDCKGPGPYLEWFTQTSIWRKK